MKKNSKFSIYYEPPCSRDDIKSLSLSFSRISSEDGTYKQKLILETNSGKYKIREFHAGASNIMRKIKKIDFSKDYGKTVVSDDNDYFLIEFDDSRIEASDKTEVQDILDLFDFDRLSLIPYYHYEYISNMYEYIIFSDILQSKLCELNKDQLLFISKYMQENNPYHVFQNMLWLNEFSPRT